MEVYLSSHPLLAIIFFAVLTCGPMIALALVATSFMKGVRGSFKRLKDMANTQSQILAKMRKNQANETDIANQEFYFENAVYQRHATAQSTLTKMRYLSYSAFAGYFCVSMPKIYFDDEVVAVITRMPIFVFFIIGVITSVITVKRMNETATVLASIRTT